MNQWSPVLVLTLFIGTCGSSRILVFYPGSSGSLLLSFNNLFQELSKRGHDLTVVTAYPLPMAEQHNITQIIMGHRFDNNVIKKVNSLPSPLQNLYIFSLLISECEDMFENPGFITFLKTNQTYDLFIGSPFYFLECSIAVAHHLKLPVINIHSNRLSIHTSHLLGHPYPYSYIAELNMHFSHHMSLWKRMMNLLFCLNYSLGLSVYYIPQIATIVKKHFPHLPPLQEMLGQIPVTLMNTNIAVHPVQPLLPGFIPVGGLSIPQHVKLPEELQGWMDDSSQGVILFSLGSNIKMTTLDPMILNVVLSVFEKLPQRVIMKWELDHLDRKPDNVRIEKWIPQAAVLAHSHCQLFMTHGGLHSWEEAVHFSVPLLGLLPTFFDQVHNLMVMQEKGHGLYFTQDWTEDNFFAAINEVLHQPKYKENLQRASNIFWDQPQNPLQRAVYWTEYVIRHRGAHHLLSVTSSMPWYQVMLLDIIAVAVLCCIFVVFVICISFKWLKRCLVDYEYILFNRTLRICNKLKIN